MKGTNPFEKQGVQVSVDQSQTLTNHYTEIPKEDPLQNLITGEYYEDLLLEAGRSTYGVPEALVEQNKLDDQRFEHLHEDDWKNLDDSENRERAARAIARREGSYTTDQANEAAAQTNVMAFENRIAKEQKKRIMWTVLLFWSLFGAAATGAQGGFFAFLVGGLVFFFGGSLVLWIASLILGMGSASGRAV